MNAFRTVAVCLVGVAPLFGQPSMPSWLTSYGGATAETKTSKVLVEATYTTTAAPQAITDHYRKLFESQSLPFHPNFDGMGSAIRGAAAECDLLIAIRAQDAGSFVRVSCAAKSDGSAPAKAPQVITTNVPASKNNTAVRKQPVATSPRQPTQARPASAATVTERHPRLAESPPSIATTVPPSKTAAAERHNQLVAELGIHRVRQDADAPALVWPNWLVHIQGAELAIQSGVDQAKNQYLKSTFVTPEPMTALFAFYKELLTSHGYPVYTGKMGTGQTTFGIKQNAYGLLEGDNYPNGSPGPRTVINIRLSRFKLNDPITVTMTFTTYAYRAPARQGF